MEMVAIRDYVTSTILTVVNIEGNTLLVDTSSIDGDWQANISHCRGCCMWLTHMARVLARNVAVSA